MKRTTVKAIIKSHGKTLMVKSLPFLKWGYVGGGVKKGEDLKSGLLREIREEIGVDLSGFNINYKDSIVYENYGIIRCCVYYLEFYH